MPRHAAPRHATPCHAAPCRICPGSGGECPFGAPAAAGRQGTAEGTPCPPPPFQVRALIKYINEATDGIDCWDLYQQVGHKVIRAAAG